ncbi:MAG: hypothetical protein IKR21_06385 [Oscillospiraceae bacterium]|nr:hypothetical protein [Oscillospiraceae bacterium]
MQIYEAASGRDLWLGRQGENGARAIVFDCSEWAETYGQGTVQAVAKRSGDYYVYPVAVTEENGSATWVINAAVTDQPGTGSFELRYYVGDTLVKSETWRTVTTEALGTPVSAPQAAEAAWGERIIAAGAAAAESAAAAAESAAAAADSAETASYALSAENLSVTANTLAAGSAATVTASKSGSITTLTFGIPRGADGAAGAAGAAGSDGADGISPTAFVTEDSDGVLFTVTDKNGTTTARLPRALDIFPVQRASDSLVTLEDMDSGMALESCRANIPITLGGIGDGAPTCSNPKPVKGFGGIRITHCGNNMFQFRQTMDVSQANNISFSLSSAGLTMTGTSVSGNICPYTIIDNYEGAIYGPIPPGTYTFREWGYPTEKSGNSKLRLTVITETGSKFIDNDFVRNGYLNTRNFNFSISQPVKFNLYPVCGEGDTFDNTVSIQLQPGDTSDLPANHEPYNGTEYDITFTDGSGEPMTIYKGSYDLITGLLTSEYASVTLDGTFTTQDISARANTTRFTIPLTGAAAEAVSADNLICSKLPSDTSVYNTDTQGAYLLADGSGVVLSVPADAGSTAASVKTWLNAQKPQVVYKLAAPVTSQMTGHRIEVFDGINRFWASVGTVSVGYRITLESYIEQKIAELI